MTLTDLADFKIGDRTVRPSLGLIVNGEASVRVEPRSIEVLLALADRGGEVYPKRELIEAVWGDTYVSDEVLTHAVWELRKAFGDNASKPEFIQTIPKRGYRIIAPVQVVESKKAPVPRESGAPDRLAWDSRLLWFGLSAAVVFVTLMAVLRSTSPPDPATTRPTRTLAIAASSSERHDEVLSARLAEDLRSELSGRPGLLPSPADSCNAPSARESDYCLEVRVTETEASHEARIEVWREGTSRFAPRPLSLTRPAETAANLGAQVVAYFEVIRLPRYSDPDTRPWFDIGRHDIRAIQHFLKGLEYTYENEVGARGPFALAIENDWAFIAPRVIRMPTLVAEGETELIEEYLQDLEELQATATPFEQAMIDFAKAFVRGSLPEQRRHLRAALRSAPGNRQITYLLATRHLEDGQIKKAYDTLTPLLEQGWEYPALFTDAVSCKIQLGEADEARRISTVALALDTVDPQLLLMLVLLSIYDGDLENEKRYRADLVSRIAEMEPEVFEFAVSDHALALAKLAEDAGRNDVARKLREFSY